MDTIANAASRDKRATRQAENLNIILGPYRIRGSQWKKLTLWR